MYLFERTFIGPRELLMIQSQLLSNLVLNVKLALPLRYGRCENRDSVVDQLKLDFLPSRALLESKLSANSYRVLLSYHVLSRNIARR